MIGLLHLQGERLVRLLHLQEEGIGGLLHLQEEVREIQSCSDQISNWTEDKSYRSLCGSLPAEKPDAAQFFLTSFYTVDTSNYPGYIVRTPTNSVQHRWPPGFSTSDLFSLLELFTRLDHRLCTCKRRVHFKYRESTYLSQVTGAV